MSISAVHARMAAIQQRFVLPTTGSNFSATLAAQTPAPSSAAKSTHAHAHAAAAAPTATPATPSAPATPPPGNWAAALPEEGKPWAGAIQKAADEAGIDPRLLASLVRAESNFQPAVQSHAGAIGLAQLMPGTAADLGVDPHDPMANLRGGARYLRSQLDRFGTPELALAAYNAGPGRVAAAGGIPAIEETQNYVVRVMDYYRQLTGESS